MLFSAIFRKNIHSLDDQDLIKLVIKKDQRAVGEFFRRYAGLVMGLCLKYLKNQTAAEDMMMTIFERLPEKILKGEIKNFKSWLYSVSRNECLMELRKTKKEIGDIDHTLMTQKDESHEALMLAKEKEEKLEALERVLEQLKPDQQKAIDLFYLKNKSYDQVAQLMKIPLKKVKSLIQNGKRNLKLKLEEENEIG